MKPFLKFIAIISVIPLLIALYFFDNIKGYYRFKEYCEKEGGLKVFEPLEKNVGWMADNKYEAQLVAQLKYVSFVRFKNGDTNKKYDLKYIGGDPQLDESYEIHPEDMDKPVTYKWVSNLASVAGENQISLNAYKVYSVNYEAIKVQFYSYGYWWFDPDKTPVGVNSSKQCFNEYYRESVQYPKSRFLREINSSFQ